mmetsp:Transcript_47937/g.155487  ORF Transcript_47937/g.155487 Transcript_47937/m.155487 type:complete len:629 (-) Transcript_47937:20-1906(-)
MLEPPCTLTVPASRGALHAVAELVATLSSAASAADVVVCLKGGVHQLPVPLALGPQHNHPSGRRVIWRGAALPSAPTTLSAGAPLRRWVRCSHLDPATPPECAGPEWDGVWAHAADDVPHVTRAALPFRQLWVGGLRAPRATARTEAWNLSTTAEGYSARGVVPGLEWAAAELRWPSQVQNWIEPRCAVDRVAGRRVVVSRPCWAALTARKGGPPPAPLLVENLLRPPPAGQFACSDRHVFYRPREPYSGPPRDAWAPLHEAILQAEGLANHSFQRLAFSHATWRQPSTLEGYVPTQSLVTPLGEPPGAVSFGRARGVAVDGCSFANLGSAYALSVGGASQQVSVVGSSFTSLAGGAVKLGNVDDERALATSPERMDSGLRVVDNTIRSAALELRGAAAIFAGYVRDTTISHNSVAETGYTAISLGWGWGTHVLGRQTFMRNNHVLSNRMERVVSALNDGGCIYTLGPQPNSTVSLNYCEADRAPVVGSFYHDNGSRYFRTTRNVASNSPAPCVYLQGCCGAPALDVAVSLAWCRGEAPLRNNCAPAEANCSLAYPGLAADCHCAVDKATVVSVPAHEAWPAEAQAVVDAAGARGGGVGLGRLGTRRAWDLRTSDFFSAVSRSPTGNN